MVTKIYKLNQPLNSAEFPLYANNGKMKVDYVFKDGNQLMKQPAQVKSFLSGTTGFIG